MDIYAVIYVWALFVCVNAKKDIDYDYLGLAIVGEVKDPPKHTIKNPDSMNIDGSDIILLRLKTPETSYKKYNNDDPLHEDLVTLEHDLRCGCSAKKGTNKEKSEREKSSRQVVNKNKPNGLPVNWEQNFSPALRHLATGCGSSAAGLLCSLRCGQDSAFCSSSGLCYCKPVEVNRVDVNADAENEINVLNSNNDSVENLEMNPALRHHIAHFCPNVELARTCIRTCMAQGKPAFCGKDHVCYCGHRYTEYDKDPEKGHNVYKEFKDMYDKYFVMKNGH